MTGFTFQSLKPQDSLSNELRSVIRDNVLQFYAKGLSAESEEEGLYYVQHAVFPYFFCKFAPK